MSIYDVSGSELNSCYDVNGNELSYAYDVNGNEIFNSIPPNTFKVMTYNCQTWTGRSGNETLMRGIFDSTRPLLVGLQECGNVGTGVYVPGTFAYGAVGEVANVNNPVAQMSNVPFTDFEAFSYASYGISGSLRGFTKCYVTIDGKTIAWFNTHLEFYTGDFSPASPHALQMDKIFEIISQEDTFILTGDFNVLGSQEYNDCIKQFVDAGFNMCNWTQATGYVDTWYEGTTIETATDSAPTDNIITSADLAIRHIEYNTAKLSVTTGQIDHLPIVATIEILET